MIMDSHQPEPRPADAPPVLTDARIDEIQAYHGSTWRNVDGHPFLACYGCESMVMKMFPVGHPCDAASLIAALREARREREQALLERNAWFLERNEWHERTVVVREQRDAAIKEREEHWAAIQAVVAQRDVVINDRDALRQRVGETEKRLRRHGAHDDDCTKYSDDGIGGCNCGFDAALAASREHAGEVLSE